jgi:hypothetical protein
MAHLVGCCVCVCCVLCFVLQPMTRRLYFFFSGRNFFQFCNNWCSYLDTTDGYLRFISTIGQTTVPFSFWVIIFSGCSLNPPKNIAGQTTVPFFPVIIFSGRKYYNWCLCQNTNTNHDPKKLRPEKKVQSSGRLCFSNHP